MWYQAVRYWRPLSLLPPIRILANCTENVIIPVTLIKSAVNYLRPDLYQGLISNSDDRGWSDGWDLDSMRSTCFPPMSDGDGLGYSFGPLNSSSDFFGALNDVVTFGSAHPGRTW